MTTTETTSRNLGIEGATIELIAYTKAAEGLAKRLPPLSDGVRDGDQIGEYAGRACYDSWERPNPKTRTNPDYITNVLGQGHESVVAHASATFHLTGVSRALTHELIRHRFLAVSERSLRFVEASNLRPVYPPAADQDEKDRLDLSFADALDEYNTAVARYEHELGYPRKQAREAARAHLPLCTETSIVVTGNYRAWRDFLVQRMSPHADREIQAVALALYRELVGLAPNTFRDLAAAAAPQRVVTGVPSS